MARARSLRRLRLSRSVWDCQRLLSVLLLSTRSFQRCAGRRVGPRNGLVLLLIKEFFFASGGAAQAAGPILRFLSSARHDLRITPRRWPPPALAAPPLCVAARGFGTTLGAGRPVTAASAPLLEKKPWPNRFHNLTPLRSLDPRIWQGRALPYLGHRWP